MDRSNKADTTLAPIAGLQATENAAEQIRKAIISGQFNPGDRLIEQQLTDQLHVSRHPVREALRLLAREGFVELRRNRGAVVAEVDASSVIEVYEIRAALGKMALAYLLGKEGRLDPKDLKRIEKLANNAVRFAAQEDQEDTVRNDLEFQQAIVEATRLQRTIRYFSELTGDVRRFNNLLGIVYTDRPGDARRYVMGLFEAIQERNLPLAQEIWQAKFSKAAQRYLSVISDRSPDGASRPGKRPSA